MHPSATSVVSVALLHPAPWLFHRKTWRWERQHRDQSVIINQTAGIVRGQDYMKTKVDSLFKTLHKELEPYALPQKVSDTLTDIVTALEFNYQLTTAVSGSLQDLSDGVFTNLANTVLMRRDSFLDTLKPGINTDTLCKLRSGCFAMETLFTEEAISQAESDLQLTGQRSKSDRQDKPSARYHPYKQKKQEGPKSDWRRFAKKKSSSSSSTKATVKSQITKPAKSGQQHK